jgi:hypothetical protein
MTLNSREAEVPADTDCWKTSVSKMIICSTLKVWNWSGFGVLMDLALLEQKK